MLRRRQISPWLIELDSMPSTRLRPELFLPLFGSSRQAPSRLQIPLLLRRLLRHCTAPVSLFVGAVPSLTMVRPLKFALSHFRNLPCLCYSPGTFAAFCSEFVQALRTASTEPESPVVGCDGMSVSCNVGGVDTVVTVAVGIECCSSGAFTRLLTVFLFVGNSSSRSRTYAAPRTHTRSLKGIFRLFFVAPTV